VAGTANLTTALGRSRSATNALSARARDFFGDLSRDPVATRAFRHGLWLVAGFSLAFPIGEALSGKFGFDAHAYYSAWTHGSLYHAPPEKLGAYLYSPAFAQAIRPLTLFPWPVFCALWLTAIAVAYLWLLAPLALRWRLPLLIIIFSFDSAGNVWALFALVIVFGLRRPALWAFPALTKVTPVLGPVWFATRKEWRSLAIAVGAILAIVAVSAAASPHLWAEWFHFLRTTHPSTGIAAPSTLLPTPVILGIGLPIAIGLTIYAARRDLPWLLPVAMVFAMPILAGQALFVLTAVPRLWPRTRLAQQPGDG
jgi:Glycosyltransferase family 87